MVKSSSPEILPLFVVEFIILNDRGRPRSSGRVVQLDLKATFKMTLKPLNKKGFMSPFWSEVPLLHRWWECKPEQPLWGTAWKLKTESPYDPAIQLLGIYLNKIINQKRKKVPPYVHSSTTPNVQDVVTTWMSTDRWTDKENVRVQSGAWSSH